jgi:hypothetical protein
MTSCMHREVKRNCPCTTKPTRSDSPYAADNGKQLSINRRIPRVESISRISDDELRIILEYIGTCPLTHMNLILTSYRTTLFANANSSPLLETDHYGSHYSFGPNTMHMLLLQASIIDDISLMRTKI